MNAKELIDFVQSLENRGLLSKTTKEFDYDWVIWDYERSKIKNASSNSMLADSKNYGHIKAVTIQVHAEYGKEGRKVVHGHKFTEEELKTLLAEKRGIADYLNHLTKVLIYE